MPKEGCETDDALDGKDGWAGTYGEVRHHQPSTSAKGKGGGGGVMHTHPPPLTSNFVRNPSSVPTISF